MYIDNGVHKIAYGQVRRPKGRRSIQFAWNAVSRKNQASAQSFGNRRLSQH
jgi:hypothetical protein